jgi:hypothetical protein
MVGWISQCRLRVAGSSLRVEEERKVGLCNLQANIHKVEVEQIRLQVEVKGVRQ